MSLHAMSSNFAWSNYNAESHLLYLLLNIIQFADSDSKNIIAQKEYSFYMSIRHYNKFGFRVSSLVFALIRCNNKGTFYLEY